MVYYLIFSLLLIFSFFNQIKLKKADIKKLEIFSFFIIIFLGGFRYEVGSDWVPYREVFLSVDSWKDAFSIRYEPLFMILSYAIKLVYSNYSFYIFIFFAISFTLKYKFISRFSPDIFLSIIVYIYTIFLIYDVNGIRQGLALGITMFSIQYIVDRKAKQFLLLSLIACLFHYSAVIFIPFILLHNINISNKKIVYSLILIMISAVFLRSLILNSSLFQTILSYDQLKHYSTYTENDIYKLNIPIVSVATFQRLFVFLSFLFLYDKISADEKVKLLLRNGYFIGIVIFLLLSFSSEFSARISFYYKAMEIIMIPLIVSAPKKIINRIVLLIIFSVFAIMGIYRLIDTMNSTLNPYNCLFFQ